MFENPGIRVHCSVDRLGGEVVRDVDKRGVQVKMWRLPARFEPIISPQYEYYPVESHHRF